MAVLSKNLSWAREHFSKYNGLYLKFDNYYRGKHPIRISDQVKDTLNELLEGLKDNLCRKVVNSLSNRLILKSISCDDEKFAQWANEYWKRLRMESKAASTNRAAIKYGDSYVIVAEHPKQPGKALIVPQDPRAIAVRYEDTGELVEVAEAVKCWIAKHPENGRNILRVTRYLPDHIERYYKDSGGSGLDSIPEDTAQLKPYNLVPGEEASFAHNHGRVPVFRFANSLDFTIFAESQLTDVIPIQDMLNKSILDLFAAGEFYGLPRRWATGLSIPRNKKTGELEKPFKSVLDAIWTVADENVTFGQFEAADLEQLLKTINDHRHEIARVSDTPAHLFQLIEGDFPSGEALQTAEAPLADNAGIRQSFFGQEWEAAIQLAGQIEGVTASKDVSAVWVDAGTKSESQTIQNAVAKKGVGVSNRVLQKELGYDDAEIDAMAKEKDEEDRRRIENAQATFNRGTIGQ